MIDFDEFDIEENGDDDIHIKVGDRVERNNRNGTVIKIKKMADVLYATVRWDGDVFPVTHRLISLKKEKRKNIEQHQYVSNNVALCPVCMSNNLNYEVQEPVGDQICYSYTCGDCGFRGKECYRLEFDTHVDRYGNAVRVGDNVNN